MSKIYRSLRDVDVEGDKWTAKLPLGPADLQHGVLANGIRCAACSAARSYV